jgi:hypothetical protein
VLTAGATDALESLVHAICDDGDSVIVPGPYWSMLPRLRLPDWDSELINACRWIREHF